MATIQPTQSVPGQERGGRNRPHRPHRQRGDPTTSNDDTDAAHQHPQRRRGGGGGGGGRGRGARDALLSLRPSSVAPSTEPSSAEVSATEDGTTPTRRGGGGRGGRGGRGQERRTANGRTFGGNLTQQNAADLQADAPVFTPGQPLINTQKQSRPLPRGPRQRRFSKSTAPDIATRTHEDIENGQYECPICTSEVLRNSKVWSCHTCWTVFHLSCIKKWSTNEGSAAARQQGLQNGDMPPPRQWRCPGCNLPKDTLPKTYSCWCEKETDPKNTPGLPPHSCGNSCGKERVRKCPHPCQLTCHAGPCPPCTHMGPLQSCFCGKHESTRRCVDTDYDAGWSCGEVCGDLMPCGEHNCERPCHEGLCGACEVRVDARCYCGQEQKEILCCDRSEEKSSRMKHTADSGEDIAEEWEGIFACANTCGRPFDCGKHSCEKSCHSQEEEPSHCPRSPDVVSHCPCGKTRLPAITESARTSCQDGIPNCDKKCGKQLSCGHACDQVCHSGDCLPCLNRVQINCRCGRTTHTTICHQGTVEPPQCMRVCRVTLSCGRHACDERCCPGERKAAERHTGKRKQRPIDSAPRPVDEGFEAEHICTRMCGRPLKCGNHTCEELCHKGPCGSCREAIFEEISCHCGRTVLDPPLPCGTKPPPCRFQCERPKACGHPQVQHNCHQDDETCPKCPFLVERRCACGKKMMKNQQCWLQEVRCGEICGRKLKCGSHFCRKTCHRSGDCEDAGGQQCQQPCGKSKTACGHPDENMCHAPYPCKEEKACPSKIFITCDCQAQKQEAKCCASRSSAGNLQKKLSCNDECARLERNRKLALALNIDQAEHTDGGDHIPYCDETLALFQRGPKWAQTQEREFRVFAADVDEKRFRFKPMPSAQRAFLHHLADDFGFDSESMDPEPHRHVAIFKTPRFVSAPNKTVADCVRIRKQQLSLTAKAAAPAEVEKKTRPNEVGVPFNAFVLSNTRFGLTVDDVRTELVATLGPSHPLQFDVEFLPSEEVILKVLNRGIPEHDVEESLKTLKPALATAISAKALGNLKLCHTDSSLNILRLESDTTAGDGWSRVAAKGAAPRRINPTAAVGGNNTFSALSGNKVTFARKKEPVVKKKPVKVDVVDDWETAELEEEEKEKERAGSGYESRGEKVEVTGASDLAQESAAEALSQETIPDVPDDVAVSQHSVEDATVGSLNPAQDMEDVVDAEQTSSPPAILEIATVEPPSVQPALGDTASAEEETDKA